MLRVLCNVMSSLLSSSYGTNHTLRMLENGRYVTEMCSHHNSRVVDKREGERERGEGKSNSAPVAEGGVDLEHDW